jgi:hypothetical protein
VPGHVHLALSIPPEDVSDQEFSDWYERHVGEALALPGFLAARRYWVAQAVPGRPPSDFRHLAVYVMEGSPRAPLAELGRRMRGGEASMPDWFGRIRFASFDGRPLEDETVEPPDHGYLVCSHAPARFTADEYNGWYYAHARENLTSEGFHTVWRYALTPDSPDEGPLGRAEHAAFYEVEGELPELQRALDESAQARRVDIPDWMGEGDFVSFDCRAASALARAR